MPLDADAKQRRRRYWLMWWFWPWLALAGRARHSDWPAIHNSLLTTWWVRIGAVFMLVAAMASQFEPQAQSPATRVFLGVVFTFGLGVLVAGAVISARQCRAGLRASAERVEERSRRWGQPRAHGWRYWLRTLCGPLVLPLRQEALPEDYEQFREWLNGRVAAGLTVWATLLLLVVLVALGPYWYPLVSAVHRALAWLLGREPDRTPELGLPVLIIVFGVPVALIAGLVWHLRHRARRRRDEAYFEQVEHPRHDEK